VFLLLFYIISLPLQTLLYFLYRCCSILKDILNVQLNNVEVGGATVFPKLQLAARPVQVHFDFMQQEK